MRSRATRRGLGLSGGRICSWPRTGAAAIGASGNAGGSCGAGGGTGCSTARSTGVGKRPVETGYTPERPAPATRLSWADVACCPQKPLFDEQPQEQPGRAGLSCSLCRWCLRPLHPAHADGEAGCTSRRKPDPADWTRFAASQPELGRIRQEKMTHV